MHLEIHAQVPAAEECWTENAPRIRAREQRFRLGKDRNVPSDVYAKTFLSRLVRLCLFASFLPLPRQYGAREVFCLLLRSRQMLRKPFPVHSSAVLKCLFGMGKRAT
jgi:hypothetical protein